VLAEVPTSDPVAGIIVKFTADFRGTAFQQHVQDVQRVAQKYDLSLTYSRTGALGANVFELAQSASIEVAQGLAQAISAEAQDVEYAEPDRVMHATALGG
jgi:hypothetical protein